MNLEQLLYGDKSRKDVITEKCTSKQVRAFSAGNNMQVSLTADEVRKLCKACNNLEYMNGYENRIRQYTISDETADRYGDIVRAKGVQLTHYKKNPVIQFAHNYNVLPVGNSLKTWYDKATNSVKSWALFFDDRVDPSGQSDLVFRFVMANAMNACSIGFDPLEYNDPDKEERDAMGLGKWGIEFTKWDLLEFSPVPVPANPNALQDEYRSAFQKNLQSTLRSGKFTAKDCNVLRKYPIFDETVIDAFIKELDDGKTVVVPELPVEPEDKNVPDPVLPVNVTVCLNADTIINDIKALIAEIISIKESVVKIQEDFEVRVAEIVAAANKGLSVKSPGQGTQILYDQKPNPIDELRSILTNKERKS